jgi:RNA polymerase sigma-70 factor (ECF subfamily)
MLDPDVERRLIEQAQVDAHAFHELYQPYFDRVFAYIAYRVGRKQDAEDLTSETFLRALARLTTFEYRGEGSFAAWLFQIARYVVSEFYRHHNQPLMVDIADVPLIQHSDFDQQIINQERFVRLRELLYGLSERRREVIILRFYGGLRNKEIAVVLGIDERTVASNLSRGLKDLQRKFSQIVQEEK